MPNDDDDDDDDEEEEEENPKFHDIKVYKIYSTVLLPSCQLQHDINRCFLYI